MDATAKPGFRGMKGLKKQRRIQIILLAFVALVIATPLIGFAMKDGINFFRSPTQVLEDPPKPSEVFRIGGLVDDGRGFGMDGGAVAGGALDGKVRTV